MAGKSVKYKISAEDKTKAGFESAMNRLKNVTKSFGPLQGAIAGAVGVGGLTMLINKTMDAGDELDKMSKKLNIPVEKLSELDYVTRQYGASIQDMSMSLKDMSMKMLETSRGSGETKLIFDELGLSVYDAQGNFKSLDSMLYDISEALGTVEDDTRMAMYATKLMGEETGQRLIPFFKAGKEELKQYTERAHELGAVMSTEDALAAAEMKDAMTDLKVSMGGVTREIVTAFFPALSDVATSTAEWLGDNKELVGIKVDEWVGKLTTAMEGLKTFADENKGLLDGVLTVSKATIWSLDNAVQGYIDIYNLGKMIANDSANNPMIVPYGMPYMYKRDDIMKAMQGKDNYFSQQNRDMFGYGSALGSNPGVPTSPGMGVNNHANYPEASGTSQPDGPKHYWTPEQVGLVLDKTGINPFEQLNTTKYLNAPPSMLQQDDGFGQFGEGQGMQDYDKALDQFDTKILDIPEHISLIKPAWVEMGNTMSGVLSNAMLQSGKTFDNILIGFRDMLAQMAAELAARAAIFGVLNAISGGSVGTFSNFVFGGFRAGGGDMQAGRAYWTGEQGPELAFPGMTTAVVSNDRIRSVLLDDRGVNRSGQVITNDNRSVTIIVPQNEIMKISPRELARKIDEAQRLQMRGN